MDYEDKTIGKLLEKVRKRQKYWCDLGHAYTFIGRDIDSYNMHRKIQHNEEV